MTNNPTELAAEICGALKAIDDVCPYEDSMGARACDRHAVIIRSLLTELEAARGVLSDICSLKGIDDPDVMHVINGTNIRDRSCDALTRLNPLLDALKG